jgi:transposase-like protein
MPAAAPVSPDQRVQCVLALLRTEDTLEGIARKAGVSGSTLSRWREEFVEGGKAALGSGKVTQNVLGRRVEELMNELADRDQVISELTVAHRILRKRAT